MQCDFFFSRSLIRCSESVHIGRVLLMAFLQSVWYAHYPLHVKFSGVHLVSGFTHTYVHAFVHRKYTVKLMNIVGTWNIHHGHGLHEPWAMNQTASQAYHIQSTLSGKMVSWGAVGNISPYFYPLTLAGSQPCPHNQSNRWTDVWIVECVRVQFSTNIVTLAHNTMKCLNRFRCQLQSQFISTR